MDFKASQIWKSEKHEAVITIYEVANGEVSFKIEAEDFEQETKWFVEVLKTFITDHGFELVNTLEKQGRRKYG